MSQQSITGTSGNSGDVEYDQYLLRLQQRFVVNSARQPLFTTDVTQLWPAYLTAMSPETRPYHTCKACRHFIERFGGLVTLSALGEMKSAFWNVEDTPNEYLASVTAMLKLVRRAKVTGVFLAKETSWGKPVTGAWHHLALTPDASQVFVVRALTAGQTMAEKREDFQNVLRALTEWTEPVMAQALTMLKADAIFRAEKVLGQTQWLYDLSSAHRTMHHNPNVVWRAIATAPNGFCHPRASMIGTLLDDITAGKNFTEVASSFRAKMHPLQYQRPTTAPTAGAIVSAEKLIETLGIARSLERRFARLDEIETLWRPAPVVAKNSTGVFGHLQPKQPDVPLSADIPAGPMTWEKFARTVLPDALAIQVFTPTVGNFAAYLTAEHADAPPIFQWDSIAHRNPFSYYVYVSRNGSAASRAADWNVRAGWCDVIALSAFPSQWNGGNFPHQQRGVLAVIAGAVDKNTGQGNALFPESLNSELHGVRAVIEAYSKRAEIAGRTEASACGLAFTKTNPITLRVTMATGVPMITTIDRID